jgi:hypothetical protein
VRVEHGEVTLVGEVEDRRAKRLAEDITEQVWGVEDVHNNLKARRGLLSSLFGGDEDRDRDRDRVARDRDVSVGAAPLADRGTTTGATSTTTTTRGRGPASSTS